jgi:hypothetical protein
MQRPGWVVYLRDAGGQFVLLTKPVKKREQAEKQREKMRTQGYYRRLALGVGFIR